MTALVVIEAVALVLLGMLVAGLLRSHAEILRRLHALGADIESNSIDLRLPGGRPEGAEPAAADVSGRVPGGGSVAMSTSRGATLLAFMSSGCAVCGPFWEAFADSPDLELPVAGARLAIVTKGPESESEAAVAALAPEGVATLMSSQAWEDYGAPVSPYFVLVEDGAVVGEGAARTWEQVLSLMSQAVADAALVDDRRLRTGERVAAVEAELEAAGIGPGHPSLYPGEGR